MLGYYFTRLLWVGCSDSCEGDRFLRLSGVDELISFIVSIVDWDMTWPGRVGCSLSGCYVSPVVVAMLDSYYLDLITGVSGLVFLVSALLLAERSCRPRPISIDASSSPTTLPCTTQS